jgi:hypothetical protein
VAFIGQRAVAIAWTLYRPLPLWIPAGWGLILLSGYVGLLITIPGGFDVTWSLVGLVPVGLLMILTAILEWTARRADALGQRHTRLGKAITHRRAPRLCWVILRH